MASSPIPALAPSTIAPIGFCTCAVIWSTISSSDSLNPGSNCCEMRPAMDATTKQAKVARDGDADRARIRDHDAEPFRGAPQIAPVRETDRDVGDGDERGCLHEQLGDADGWDHLRRIFGHRRQTGADEEAKQTEHHTEPGHVDGGFGVQRRDPRQRLAEWSQQGEAEPEPDQQQQRAENAIARE